MNELPKVNATGITVTPVQDGMTYEVCGKQFPVIGMVPAPDGRSSVPLVDIPSMSDFKWQLEALNGRLKHPEYYEEYYNDNGGSVADSVARLIDWLFAHQSQATEKELAAFDGIINQLTNRTDKTA